MTEIGNRSLSEFSSEPLSPLENQKARRLLQDSDRAHWLWSFLIKCVIVAGAMAGIAASVKTMVSAWILR